MIKLPQQLRKIENSDLFHFEAVSYNERILAWHMKEDFEITLKDGRLMKGNAGDYLIKRKGGEMVAIREEVFDSFFNATKIYG